MAARTAPPSIELSSAFPPVSGAFAWLLTLRCGTDPGAESREFYIRGLHAIPESDLWRVRADQLQLAGDPRGERLARVLAGRDLRWPRAGAPSARDVARALWPEGWPDFLADLKQLGWTGLDPVLRQAAVGRADPLACRVHLMDSGDLAFAAGERDVSHATFDTTIKCLGGGRFTIRMVPVTPLREPALPTELYDVPPARVVEHLRDRAAVEWRIELLGG